MNFRGGSHEKETNGQQLPSIWTIINDVPSQGARGHGFPSHQSNGAESSAIYNPNFRAHTPQRYLHPVRETLDQPYGAPGLAVGGPQQSPAPRFPPAARTWENRSLPDTHRLDVPRASLSNSPNGSQQTSDVFLPGSRPPPAQPPSFVQRQQVPGRGLCYIYSDGSVLPCEIDGEAVNPEWRITKQGKARKRLPRACDRCRDKKVRCEGGNPCRKCVKLDESCTWTSNVRPITRSSPVSTGSATDQGAVSNVPQVPVAHPEPFTPNHSRQESESRPSSVAFDTNRPTDAEPSTLPRPFEHTRRESDSDQNSIELCRRKRPRLGSFPPDVLTAWRDSPNTYVNGDRPHINGHKPVGESSPTDTLPAPPATSSTGAEEENRTPRASPILELPDLLKASGDREKNDLLSTEDFVRWTNESIAANAGRERAWYTAIAFGSAFSKTPELKSLAHTLDKKWKKCEKAVDLVEEMNHNRKLKEEANAAA